MARKEDNPNQIVRIDGNKCFMEALKNAFEIKKVQMNFYQYDVNRPKGDRYTAEIPIYIDFKDFDSIFYEIMIGGSKIKEMNRLAADPNKKQWEKQLIIYRGGFEKDGQIKARQLKNDITDLRLKHEYSKSAPIVTISQGICIAVPSEVNRGWDFLHLADNYLYHVKRKCRNAIGIGDLKKMEHTIF